MKIISRRNHVETEGFLRVFNRRDDQGGFMFPCHSDGTLMSPPDSAKESFADCLANPELYEDRGVTTKVTRYTEPAVGECENCRRRVTLAGFTNTCQCGADYNMSGSRLAPREQWGEETGESVSDILAADRDW